MCKQRSSGLFTMIQRIYMQKIYIYIYIYIVVFNLFLIRFILSIKSEEVLLYFSSCFWFTSETHNRMEINL